MTNFHNLDDFLDSVNWPQERKRRLWFATFNAPTPLKYVLMDNVPIALLFEMAFLESKEPLGVIIQGERCNIESPEGGH